jgi:hypothetical protein
MIDEIIKNIFIGKGGLSNREAMLKKLHPFVT